MNQPAAGGFGLGGADFDETAVQVDVAPIESRDFRSAQSSEQADCNGGKDLRPQATSNACAWGTVRMPISAGGTLTFTAEDTGLAGR